MAMTGMLPIWIALFALGLLVAVVFWANQREATLQAVEVRASQAEARAATAEAVVTAQAEMQAATATALAYASSPAAAVDRSLRVLLAAERQPTTQHLQAVNDAFGPAALNVVRPEIEHLLSGGLHLGDDSVYQMTVTGTTYPGADQAQVSTQERWMYDELTGDNQRSRCLVETSDQTYTLQHAGADWQVADIQVTDSARSDCSSP